MTPCCKIPSSKSRLSVQLVPLWSDVSTVTCLFLHSFKLTVIMYQTSYFIVLSAFFSYFYFCSRINLNLLFSPNSSNFTLSNLHLCLTSFSRWIFFFFFFFLRKIKYCLLQSNQGTILSADVHPFYVLKNQTDKQVNCLH